MSNSFSSLLPLLLVTKHGIDVLDMYRSIVPVCDEECIQEIDEELKMGLTNIDKINKYYDTLNNEEIIDKYFGSYERVFGMIYILHGYYKDPSNVYKLTEIYKKFNHPSLDYYKKTYNDLKNKIEKLLISRQLKEKYRLKELQELLTSLKKLDKEVIKICYNVYQKYKNNTFVVNSPEYEKLMNAVRIVSYSQEKRDNEAVAEYKKNRLENNTFPWMKDFVRDIVDGKIIPVVQKMEEISNKCSILSDDIMSVLRRKNHREIYQLGELLYNTVQSNKDCYIDPLYENALKFIWLSRRPEKFKEAKKVFIDYKLGENFEWAKFIMDDINRYSFGKRSRKKTGSKNKI